MEKQGFIDLKTVKDQPFILLKKGFRLRNVAYELFQENGIMPPIVMKTVNVNLSHHMTSAGRIIQNFLIQPDRLSVLPHAE